MSFIAISSLIERDETGVKRLTESAEEDIFDGGAEPMATPLPMTPFERSADPAIISNGEANKLGGGEP